MFGKRVTLFTLLGFAVRVDLSWLVVAVLVTWSLAEGVFPRQYQGLSKALYWGMGVAGMVGLFASIVVHELMHSLIARHYGLPMKGITLFIFGGVAEMDQEPPSAKAEGLMAIAGPLVSLLLALGCAGLGTVGERWAWPEPVTGVLGYLGFINRVVAIFNLLPAFPLDGGRVLRAVLWAWLKNLQRATRIAARLGTGFSLLLLFLGVLNMLRGNIIGGMWMFLISVFLGNAAVMSYQQLIVRRALEGEPVRRFMAPTPVTVPPTLTVEELVEEYIYTYHFKMFPVVDHGNLVGCVTTREVQQIPRHAWKQQTVGDLLQPCSPANTISPHDDALKALALMNQTRASRLMVVEGDRLVGVIALKDLLEFLALKVELEERTS